LAEEGVSRRRQPVDTKVGNLTPRSRAVNIIAKTISKGEVREVASRRDGQTHRVCDLLIGDETGCVYLTLWDDDVEKVEEGDTVNIKNGYVKLFKGSIRLNVGRYGTLETTEEPLEVEVDNENNVSTKIYEQYRRPYRQRRSGYRRY
jgi:replication factor A1